MLRSAVIDLIIMSENKSFIIYAAGIFCCYSVYGILQEKITRGRYGEDVNADGTIGERFTFTLALVGIQCICNWIFAKGMLLSKPQPADTTHQGYYASCALTYLLAMVTSNMALRWVPYPMQVVGKSAKPIPVMILGVLIGRKSYSIQRYVCVILIVIGVILFMYKDKTPTTQQDGLGWGEILLFFSLSMDGMTGAIQERMRAASSPSGQQMMLAMNWWSSVALVIALVVSGEGVVFVEFAARYPAMLVHLSLLALTGALGQLFIFLMVSSFGPLACSVVTTTRKFFTVFFSVFLFGNVLSYRQWAGAVLVFSGLFADILFGKKKPSPSPTMSKKVTRSPEREKLIGKK